jgi:hypothetical protein
MGSAGVCTINIHSYRDRKCGPGFKLAVFQCKSHVLTFTVYPPGWLPYGRRPLVGDDSTFQAVDDLSRGVRWPEVSGRLGFTRKTQDRWISSWSTLALSILRAVL